VTLLEESSRRSLAQFFPVFHHRAAPHFHLLTISGTSSREMRSRSFISGNTKIRTFGTVYSRYLFRSIFVFSCFLTTRSISFSAAISYREKAKLSWMHEREDSLVSSAINLKHFISFLMTTWWPYRKFLGKSENLSNFPSLVYGTKSVAIYGPMIYTTMYIMLLMRTNPLQRQVGGGLGPGNRDFFWVLWNGTELLGECHLGSRFRGPNPLPLAL
jgi:hypothetical protein